MPKLNFFGFSSDGIRLTPLTLTQVAVYVVSSNRSDTTGSPFFNAQRDTPKKSGLTDSWISLTKHKLTYLLNSDSRSLTAELQTGLTSSLACPSLIPVRLPVVPDGEDRIASNTSDSWKVNDVKVKMSRSEREAGIICFYFLTNYGFYLISLWGVDVATALGDVVELMLNSDQVIPLWIVVHCLR